MTQIFSVKDDVMLTLAQGVYDDKRKGFYAMYRSTAWDKTFVEVRVEANESGLVSMPQEIDFGTFKDSYEGFEFFMGHRIEVGNVLGLMDAQTAG